MEGGRAAEAECERLLTAGATTGVSSAIKPYHR
jgi:hypothetical protein